MCTRVSSWTSASARGSTVTESFMIYLPRRPRPRRTSVPSALVRRVTTSLASHCTMLDQPSTASSPGSWLRVVTSPTTTVPAVSPSTESDSQTRASMRVTMLVAFSRWPMLAPTLMVLNSTSRSKPRLISTANTSSLVKSSKAGLWLTP